MTNKLDKAIEEVRAVRLEDERQEVLSSIKRTLLLFRLEEFSFGTSFPFNVDKIIWSRSGVEVVFSDGEVRGL